jgi:hypothetical protein
MTSGYLSNTPDEIKRRRLALFRRRARLVAVRVALRDHVKAGAALSSREGTISPTDTDLCYPHESAVNHPSDTHCLAPETARFGTRHTGMRRFMVAALATMDSRPLQREDGAARLGCRYRAGRRPGILCTRTLSARRRRTLSERASENHRRGRNKSRSLFPASIIFAH